MKKLKNLEYKWGKELRNYTFKQKRVVTPKQKTYLNILPLFLKAFIFSLKFFSYKQTGIDRPSPTSSIRKKLYILFKDFSLQKVLRPHPKEY